MCAGSSVIFEEAGYSPLGPLALELLPPPTRATCTCSSIVATPSRRSATCGPLARGPGALLLRHDRAGRREPGPTPRCFARGATVDGGLGRQRREVVHHRRRGRGLRASAWPARATRSTRDAGATMFLCRRGERAPASSRRDPRHDGRRLRRRALGRRLPRTVSSPTRPCSASSVSGTATPRSGSPRPASRTACAGSASRGVRTTSPSIELPSARPSAGGSRSSAWFSSSSPTRSSTSRRAARSTAGPPGCSIPVPPAARDLDRQGVRRRSRLSRHRPRDSDLRRLRGLGRPPARSLPRRGATVPYLRRAVRNAPLGDRATDLAATGRGARAMTPVDIVETAEEADDLDLAPLLVLQSVEDYLDGCGLGEGSVTATRIGEGRSNVTYLIERGGARLVLRRPPRPPLPPSAHDVVREARVQQALERAGARVPHVVHVCEDESVLGVPFYLTAYLEGCVVGDELPAALDPPQERRRIGLGLVDALAEIHAIDWEAAGLSGFGRPTGYLERQLRRWSALWEENATRPLHAVPELGAWLEANRPESGSATVVHGDYRLGNVMLSTDAPARVLAVLDWELSTIGDPLADLGYLLATYSEAGSPRTPLELSPVTAARASRAGGSSPSVTPSAVGPRLKGCRGTKRSRCGRRQSSARRSTVGTSARSPTTPGQLRSRTASHACSTLRGSRRRVSDGWPLRHRSARARGERRRPAPARVSGRSVGCAWLRLSRGLGASVLLHARACHWKRPPRDFRRSGAVRHDVHRGSSDRSEVSPLRSRGTLGGAGGGRAGWKGRRRGARSHPR